MDILTTILIAFGLAMDAFAVSIVRGASLKNVPVTRGIKMAVYFGVFQAMMPVLGWFLGFHLRGIISSFDHWIAFVLLAFVGGRMIFQSVSEKEKTRADSFDNPTLLILAVATSIDALAVGLSLALLSFSIFLPAIIIGLVTFLLSLTGVLIGKRVGHFFENKIEFIGGLILLGIGIKILFDHLF
ncbi:MAG: manganese efflux pump MntP family protein [Candidatus Omnitrophota bacterium]